MGAFTLCVSFLISFFFKLIVACRFCVIYVKEDNDSNVKGFDYMACMDYMDPGVHCPPNLITPSLTAMYMVDHNVNIFIACI